MRLRRLLWFCLCASVAAVLSGCGVSSLSVPSESPTRLATITGSIHGGQQAISGALIQLYAANSTTLRGASTPLITSTVLSDANGGFSLSGDFTCPSSDALVYIVATGGNPGITGTVNNSGIAMMTALGSCSSITSAITITINELTTVAAIEALAPFMIDFAHVGTATPSSLALAFSNAVNDVNPQTGQFYSVSAAGAPPPIAIFDTLANILASCINTSGGVGSGTACGSLYQLSSGAVQNTISALLHIVQNPNANVTALYALAPSTSPFQPALNSAPTTFAVFVGVPIGVITAASYDQLFSDTQGHIWLYAPAQGALTQYDTHLKVLHSYTVYSGYSGDGVAGIAALDPSDNLWVPTGPLTLMKLGPDGSVKSPAGDYSANTTGLLGPLSGIKFDSLGNAWFAVIRASDTAVCAVEYSPDFTLISPSSGYCSPYTYGAQIDSSFLTPDSSGNMYQFSFGQGSVPVIKYTQSGNVSTFTTQASIFGAASDLVNQRLLALSQNNLTSYKLDGSVVFSNASRLLLANFNALTTDGGGNLWIATETGSLAEVSPTGIIVNGCTNTFCGIPVDLSALGTLAGITVDAAGDVFTVDTKTGDLRKYPGIAFPR
jgi:hypothetical protein